MPSKQEIRNAVRSSGVDLTDASTTTWDYSTGNVAYWTINGNNTLSITGISPTGDRTKPSYGTLQITQGAAGNFLPSLPNDDPSATNIAWNFAPGAVNLLSFFYNGTTFKWSSADSIPFAYGDQLLSPGSFSATAISNTEIDLTWTASSNADNYVVDRALDSGFTTGVTLGIYSGPLLLFNDTTRTIATQYFYRIKAQDTSGIYRTSSYVFANATTTGGLITINGFGVLTESPTGTWNAAARTADKAAQRMAGDGYVQMSVLTSANQLAVLGLDDSATVNDIQTGSTNNWLYSIYAGIGASGTAHYFMYNKGESGSGGTDTGITWTTNDLVRLRRAGTAVVAEKSVDSGATWTLVHTCTVASAANLYIKAVIAAGGQKLLLPKGLGIA